MRRQYLIALVLLAVAFPASSALPQTTKSKPAPDAGSAALYQKQCAKCHLQDGKGIAGLNPPNFTDAKWQSTRTDAQLTKSIQEGKGVMPAFKDVLTPQQVTGLIKYIRAFKANTAAAK